MSILAARTRGYAVQPARPGTAAWLCAAVAVGLEIAYPLLSPGTARDDVTVATVCAFFLASVGHAARTRGVGAAAALVVLAAGGGFAVEVAGVHTGRPFGHYAYAASLGPRALGVPVAVGLAWAMMAWPALLVGRRLAGRRRWAVPLVAGWALASWDVFLDPQMVDAGHWTWTDVGRTLPGVPDVPLGNFAGWLAVAVVLMVLLNAAVPGRTAADALPYTLYLWTFASSVLANVAFFDRPAVAAAGGIAMGVVVLPLAVSLWRSG